MSKMMRISDETAKNLEMVARVMGDSKQRILEKALDLYARDLFLQGANEDYKRFEATDPEGYALHLKDLQAWDVTLSDGLSDE